MRYRLLGLCAAATFLISCGVSPQAGTSDRRPSAVRAAAQSRGSVIDLVERARLEATLSTLSGRTALLAGPRIPERGTVEGRGLTREFLASSLTAMGYTVERHGYRANGENIYVKLMAEIPTTETILVGSHLDSVRNAGANDNATGSTAVLEVARVIKGLSGRKVNVIFAWFDEEELGLVGSTAMARSFKKQGLALSSVHTMDMMGWDSDGDKAIEIERPDGGLWEFYKQINEKHALGLPLSRTNSGATDHVAFRAEGYASVGLSEEWTNGDTTPHYHKKSDTYETINFDYLAAGTKLLAAAVGDLARKTSRVPNVSTVPHTRFPGRDHCSHDETDTH